MDNFTSGESFMKRNPHIRVYGKDSKEEGIQVGFYRVRMSDQTGTLVSDSGWKKEGSQSDLGWWVLLAVVVLVLATLATFSPIKAKAETINSPLIGNESDKIQERTYCAQILIDGRKVLKSPGMQAIKNHCKEFGV